jgi:hypothetical protein
MALLENQIIMKEYIINLFSVINIFMHEKDIGNPRFCIKTDTKTQIDLK